MEVLEFKVRELVEKRNDVEVIIDELNEKFYGRDRKAQNDKRYR